MCFDEVLNVHHGTKRRRYTLHIILYLVSFFGPISLMSRSPCFFDSNMHFDVPLLLIYGVFDAIFVLPVCGASFDAFRGVSVLFFESFSRCFYVLFSRSFLVLFGRLFCTFSI